MVLVSFVAGLTLDISADIAGPFGNTTHFIIGCKSVEVTQVRSVLAIVQAITILLSFVAVSFTFSNLVRRVDQAIRKANKKMPELKELLLSAVVKEFTGSVPKVPTSSSKLPEFSDTTKSLVIDTTKRVMSIVASSMSNPSPPNNQPTCGYQVNPLIPTVRVGAHELASTRDSQVTTNQQQEPVSSAPISNQQTETKSEDTTTRTETIMKNIVCNLINPNPEIINSVLQDDNLKEALTQLADKLAQPQSTVKIEDTI